MPLKNRKPLLRKSSLKPGGFIKRRAKLASGTKRMRVGKNKRLKPDALEKLHLARIGEMPCLVTGKPGIVVHHIMKCPGKTKRRDHRFVVPLIPELHNMGSRSVHALGSEEKFKSEHKVDLVAWALREWEWTVANLGP